MHRARRPRPVRKLSATKTDTRQRCAADAGLQIPVTAGRALAAAGPQQIVSDGNLVYFTAARSVGGGSVAKNQLVAEAPTGISPISMDLTGALTLGRPSAGPHLR